MNPKYVSPKPTNKKTGSGLVKVVTIGVVSGMLGAGLFTGGYYLLTGNNPISSTSSSSSSSTKGGATQVSNIKANVTTDTTEAVEKVGSAVVTVRNLVKQSSTTTGGLYGGLFDDTESNSGNNSSAASDELVTQSEGSGVIYKKNSKTAYIVTNNHVIEGNDSVEVILKDGTKLTAKVVGADSYSDLAVLSVDASKITTTAEFGDSDSVKVGETAIAIGSPLGSEYSSSVTQGVISATNRSIEVEETQTENGRSTSTGTKVLTAIQTDAAINPGNSGGPLINLEGQIIGINSVKLTSSGSTSSSSTSVEGMGFAIPSNDVVSIINQLVKNGKVIRPYIGITMSDLSSISKYSQDRNLSVPSGLTTGVVVMSVQSGGPASKAGLKAYDIIVDIDGEEVTSYSQLRSILYKKNSGDKIKVKFYRDGKEKTVTVTLGTNSSSN